jgi:hypothetical protein
MEKKLDSDIFPPSLLMYVADFMREILSMASDRSPIIVAVPFCVTIRLRSIATPGESPCIIFPFGGTLCFTIAMRQTEEGNFQFRDSLMCPREQNKV